VASKTRRELIEQRRRIVYAGLQLVSFREISVLIFVFLPLIIGIFTTLVAALLNPGAELTVAARGILYTGAFTLGGYLVHHLIILSLPTAEELSGVSAEELEQKERELRERRAGRSPSPREGEQTPPPTQPTTPPQTEATEQETISASPEARAEGQQ